MRAYHATRAFEAIKADGIVKPMRLKSVYLFGDLMECIEYAIKFKYDWIVIAEYDPSHVASIWKPSYAKQGGVIKLKPGACARYVA
jgi:hypothetical protein